MNQNLKNYIKEFGLKTFLISGSTRVLKNILTEKQFEKYYEFKHNYLIQLLDKEYGSEVNKSNGDCSVKQNIKEDSPIWVFWLQGEDSMPSLVKACYKSILNNTEKHTVILLTKDNVREYVNLPEYIYEKLNSKKMLPAFFSDIVRENLLYEYGGVWMDATMYMTAPLPDEIYNYKYYTIKGVSPIWDWTTFFQASGKGNVFPKEVSHLFNCYWKNHDGAITYLLFDCLFAVARKHNIDIDEQIKKLPSKDNSIFIMLDEYIEAPYSEEIIKMLNEKTSIHKLTYKVSYREEINGKQTIWGHLLNEGIAKGD